MKNMRKIEMPPEGFTSEWWEKFSKEAREKGVEIEIVKTTEPLYEIGNRFGKNPFSISRIPTRIIEGPMEIWVEIIPENPDAIEGKIRWVVHI